jgi:hypothetical protein
MSDKYGFPQHERLNEVADPQARASSDQFDASLLGFLAKGHNSDGKLTSIDRIADVTEWKDVPYDATLFGQYGGAGGVWTVPPATVLRFAYKIIGKSMHLHVTIGGLSTITVGTVQGLLITIPDGYIADEYSAAFCAYSDNVNYKPAFAVTNAGVNKITILLIPIALFAITPNQGLFFQIEIRIR